MDMRKISIILLVLIFGIQGQAQKSKFTYLDIFGLQYISDPQISPNSERIVYRKMGFDILNDGAKGNLWTITTTGGDHQKLTSNETNEHSPRWSPSGNRIAFVSATDEGAEIYMHWVNSGKTAKLTQLPFTPSSLTWSPDGQHLAFSMNVEKAAPVLAKVPKKPKGAKWADAPRITDRVYHEADGRGYLKPGFNHIFVMPASGGALRQLTSGDWHHRGTLSWSKDGTAIYFSANRIPDWEYRFRNSEIYKVNVTDGTVTALTQKDGPDYEPQVSPNGKHIAYLGFEDKVQAYNGHRRKQ